MTGKPAPPAGTTGAAIGVFESTAAPGSPEVAVVGVVEVEVEAPFFSFCQSA